MEEFRERSDAEVPLRKAGTELSSAPVQGKSTPEESLSLPLVTLQQNSLNPFNQQTTIIYEVQTEARQVVPQIHDAGGKLHHTFTNLPAKGQFALQAGELPAGTYLYSLLVDGQVADTKRMIIT